MQNFAKLKNNTQQTPITASLILISILSLGSGFTLNNPFAAFADSDSIHTEHNSKKSEIKPILIPKNQLPPPLDRAVIFREISSGGITGATYQTTLLNDGTLIRVKLSDANDSERSVRRVSGEQLKQFKKLLQTHNLTRFNRLSYPAPRGAADYITYTITNKEGTFQYNDISRDGLPNKLHNVVLAWNQLKTSAKPLTQ